MGAMNKFSFGVFIFTIFIILTIGNVESAAAVDSVKFDQLNFIINDHTDIISFVDEAPYEGSTVSVTLDSSDTNPSKTFVLTQDVPNSHIFRTIVKFSTTCTLPCASNELKVATGDVVTLAKNGVTPVTITMKVKDGGNPVPLYGNNKFTTNAAPPCTDIDLDAICDNWEPPISTTLNINYPSGTYAPLGGTMLELRPPTTANNQKDIYLEIDYMQGHRPNLESLWDVINGFDVMGITLHIQLDDEGGSGTLIPHAVCTRWPGTNLSYAKGFDQIAGTYFGTLAERQAATDWGTNGWIRKHQVFHYALFTHAQCGSTSSGVAEIGGDELMVTLGVLTDDLEPVSPDQISGTLMHELGHNLNLNHGGAYGDTKNCKPTHMSVMSYSRQWTDLVPNRNLEYSRAAVDLEGTATITENTLNEELGLDGYPDPLEEITWGVPPAGTPPLNRAIVGAGEVDWDQDDTIELTIPAQNLNTISALDGDVVCPTSPSTEPLLGHNDVAALVYNIRSDGDWQDGRSVGERVIESPFCLPVETILSSVPTSVTLPQSVIDFFNSFRSCAGGRGETNSTLILQAYQNATILNGTALTKGELEELAKPIPSSDELTPDKMITMRLSRIDSIMVYLQHNTIDKDFTNADKNENLKFYQGETDTIKKSIENHQLLDVLDQLTTLYDSYSNRVTDNDKLSDLKKGTLDIYNSINKAVLGPSMIVDGKVVQVVQNGKINPVFIAELMILHPDLFDDDREIKTDYKTFIKNGNLLVSEWKIVKKGEEVRDDPMYLKPRQMLKFVDKIDVVCNEGLVKLDKPDGKSVVCVKESTKEKLGAIWGTSKTIMTQN